MHAQFLENPTLVPQDWRDYFSGMAASNGATHAGHNGVPAADPHLTAAQPVAQPATVQPPTVQQAAQPPAAQPSTAQTVAPPPSAALPAVAAPAVTAPADAEPPATTPQPEAPPAEEPGRPLRGAAARIVANMEASLEVPTATSFREVPAKLLEVNRRILNNHLQRVRGGKVSFTHVIGYALVRAAADDVPAMTNTYAEGSDGKPRLITADHVNLGIAVDVPKSDGSRSLMVPVIKAAEAMNFAEFVDAYEALIAKVRGNKLSVDDLTGANISLTNPGTVGTVQSVPRLMPGQGAIIGVGRIGYPAEYQGADPKMLAQLGLSKIMNFTSTYDHRVIQGAESGLFLKRVHEYLMGQDGFYEGAFDSLNLPYTSVKWHEDHDTSDDGNGGAMAKQMAVNTLINQYRVRGHHIAITNPLQESPTDMHPELDPATFGLTIWDLDREFLTGLRNGLYAAVGGQPRQMKLGDILGELRDAYCRTIGIEYMHISDPTQKRWIQEQVEGVKHTLSRDEQHHILERLTAAEALERFLATRYVGQKRFGLEGTESVIPVLDELLNEAAEAHLERAVLGMPHRGRLNVLVNIMGKTYEQLFTEFDGKVSDSAIQGSGDVKYHLGFDGVHISSRTAEEIQISLAANPSHLEAVDPVVEGMVRAYMDDSDHGNYPILPILLHGDAAFAGQGVVMETLNLSQVRGYAVGGTVHVVVNNQLGYTTAPHQSRSSQYSTDVAKMVQAPIFHVNADDPEACVRVARLAFAFRQEFNRDVVIDVIGYRRHGHNEGDDPSYTQPLMYRKIGERETVRTIYTQALIDRGQMTLDEANQAMDYFNDLLRAAMDATRSDAPANDNVAKPAPPPVGVLPRIETGVSAAELDRVYQALTTQPDGFTVHPKLAKQFEARDALWGSGEIDWALGEAMAFGSLLIEGTSVRLAGQDSRRGTFAHRHATLHDAENGDEYTSLSSLASGSTEFWVYDSTLSEYAGLGFEYGYSLVKPETLVIWEAQFGDFANGAQIIIDQFLVAAEDKWNQQSRLTMLLPHGYEGQGPEHSSGRLERFLLLCAEDNIQVVQPTTAAQVFHLFRRQMKRTEPEASKPLVVFTPKSLLRAKSSRSPRSELEQGSFYEVLPDAGGAKPKSVKRVVFASGKVAVEAADLRDERGAPVAIARVEQLYPWPFDAVAETMARFPKAKEIVWLQEEPENMGAWNAIKGRLYEAHGDKYEIRRVSRTESGSPATGSNAIHKQEQAQLLDRALSNLG